MGPKTCDMPLEIQIQHTGEEKKGNKAFSSPEHIPYAPSFRTFNAT